MSSDPVITLGYKLPIKPCFTVKMSKIFVLTFKMQSLLQLIQLYNCITAGIG